MVHRQASAASPDLLPYDLHHLGSQDGFASADYGKWTTQGSPIDSLCSAPGLSQESTSGVYEQGYPVGPPYSVDLQSAPINMHYPNIVDPPFSFMTSEPESYDPGSPYARQNSISRMTPQSQVSVSAAGTRAGSGRSTTKSSSPGFPIHRNSARVAKSRPRRAHRASKAVVGKYKKLDMPLSQWAAENAVEPKDVKAYIERPLEQRRQEARDKKDGKPGRPMNQFMLYRSAFIPIAQRYCEDGEGKNHQVVSRLCGESWQSEPDDFKRIYEGLAKKEREQHALAFPDYKFAPKNKDRVEDEEEDELLNDDEWKPRSRQSQPLTGRVKPESPYMHSLYGNPFQMHEGQFDFDQGIGMNGGFGIPTSHPPPPFGPRAGGAPGDVFEPYYPQPVNPAFMEMHRPSDLPFGQLASIPGQEFGGRFADEPHLSAYSGAAGPYGLDGQDQQLDPSLLLRHGEQDYRPRLVESSPLYDD